MQACWEAVSEASADPQPFLPLPELRGAESPELQRAVSAGGRAGGEGPPDPWELGTWKRWEEVPGPLTCRDRAFLWEGLPTRPCSLRFLNFRKYSWIRKVA